MKKINKLLLVIASMALVFGPCYVNAEEISGGEENKTVENENGTTGSDNEGEEEEVNGSAEEQKSIKFDMDDTESVLSSGETIKLKIIVTPSDATVTWLSSNEEVAKVDSTGLVTAGNKSGEITITAKLNDVIKAEYKIKVNAPKNNDSSLKSLSVNGKLDKEFNSDVLEYNVTIDKDVTSLDFEYELSDSNAKAFLPSDTKNKDLKNGDVLSFKVVAENGEDNRTYQFKIVKEASSLNLSSLYINGYALNEIFDPSVTDYTASIPYEIETITVRASSEATENEVSMKVSGITNLKVGENTVKVVLTDKSDSTKTKTYTIVVTREKEVTVEENPTSIITSSGITGEENNDNSSDSGITNNNDKSGDDFFKYAIVSLACLILFAIGGIGIYFYIKTSPKKLKKEVLANKKEESPIVEINNKDTSKNQENIEKMMDEKLIETREFKQEDLKEIGETENLFDDREDV